jgi:PadR family transcriptional regulator AphA
MVGVIRTVSVVSSSCARLGTTSYTLLGAVAEAGPCSPYDLKRVVARLVGPLWEVPHSQVYDEAARLAKAGLLDEAQEGTGRRRLTYTITEAGRRELVRWLRVPSRERMELRDTGLLKLAFAAELAPAEMGHVAEDHADAWRALRAELAAVPGEHAPATEYTLAVADAAVTFWETLRDRLPGVAAVA